MKTLLTILFLLLALLSNKNEIFTEDVLVKDINGKEVNLKDFETTKDTVMVFLWAKWCGACKMRLDYYKANKRYRNYQILAIAVTQGDSIDKEKEIINKHQWPFQIYFDNNQNIAKFFIKKGYFKQPKEQKDFGFYGFPQTFMFVKNIFLCKSCDKYANPYSQKKVK